MPVTIGATNVTYGDNSVESSLKSPVRAIFGYGTTFSPGIINLTNLVNNYGGVATDRTNVSSARMDLAAAGFGGDKAIFGFGRNTVNALVNITNHVTNLGDISSDITNSSNFTRVQLSAATYGFDKAIFAYGVLSGYFNTVGTITYVSNTGIIGSDGSNVSPLRYAAGASYGFGQAIFAFGKIETGGGGPDPDGATFFENARVLVTASGVFGTFESTVGSSRAGLAAASYGGDRAIFGYGSYFDIEQDIVYNITNHVSNTGVVSSDIGGVGTPRHYLAAAGYGGDKAIFGYGGYAGLLNITNLVSNVGVVASDTTGVGTSRINLAAASYSS